MKHKLFMRLAILIVASVGVGSTGALDAQPMPPFKMTLSNNKIFAAEDLPKGRPAILIYFDPDCDHCKNLMKEFFQKIGQFRKAEIMMVTFKPASELPPFEREHDISKYPNIKVGSETISFFLRFYYDVTTMPFTALYDKKGNMNYSYRKETPVDDLIARLKKIE